jgi:predicted dehydrogenase
MRFLIAGFGSIGRRHFRNLLALGERDIIFLRSNRSTLPDDEISEYPVETEVAAALDHKPDAVIIANPTALHLDIAIPAGKAGCHLFIEKPISDSLDRVDELQTAMKLGGGDVLVGFQYRYHPQLRQILTLLEGNAIGQPVSVRVHWGEYLPGWHPWEDYKRGFSARKDLGGGVVLTLCHPLDYLRWLLGDIDELWAFTSQVKPLGINVEANAEIGLRFKNGVLGTVHLDYVQRPHKHFLEIIGTEGTINWDYVTGTMQVYYPTKDQPENYKLPAGYERNDMFLGQMRHFLAIINGEKIPCCSLMDGIMAQQLANAVIESDRVKCVVRFDWKNS